MEYLGITLSALLTTIFVVFVIVVLGFLIGGVKVKGISLGTAGVLLVAIVAGVIFYLCGNEQGETVLKIGSKSVAFWNSSVSSTFSLISNLGTVMFVTAVGLIAGPKFFRSIRV